MPRKKKDDFPKSFIANVLIYDKENISYRHCVPVSIESEPRFIEYDGGFGYTQRDVISNTIVMQTGVYEELNNIELDPTTMKRIAVYNKTRDCKKLDKEIKEKEEKIKELDEKLQDKERRWKKVKDFVANIYEINLDDDYDCDNYDCDDYE